MRKTGTDEYFYKYISCSYKKKNMLGMPYGKEKYGECLAILRIPAGTFVYSQGNQHRTSEASVEEITVETERKAKVLRAWSKFRHNKLSYSQGKIVRVNNFSFKDKLSGAGIHGFTYNKN